MPEKTCLTTAEILSAALSLLREGGSFTASALAARLGTSPRVIFRHCPAMDALQAQTRAAAWDLYAALTDRPFRRAAFIGASPKEIHTFQTLLAHRSLVLAFFDDTEKAKAWLTAKEA